jgi:hypothetical protein
MIQYRRIIVSDTKPSDVVGRIWIKPLGSSTYQAYIFISTWLPLIAGGTFITETGADEHRINVVIQEEKPDSFIQVGWLWIKESINQAFIYSGSKYLPLIGA